MRQTRCYDRGARMIYAASAAKIGAARWIVTAIGRGAVPWLNGAAGGRDPFQLETPSPWRAFWRCLWPRAAVRRDIAARNAIYRLYCRMADAYGVEPPDPADVMRGGLPDPLPPPPDPPPPPAAGAMGVA